MRKLFAFLILFSGLVLAANAFAEDWGDGDSSTLDNEEAADYQGQGTGGAYANS